MVGGGKVKAQLPAELDDEHKQMLNKLRGESGGDFSGSDKVEGTAVYGADDRKIGTVQRAMIDKISGKVAYAVISFGGFLGMGA